MTRGLVVLQESQDLQERQVRPEWLGKPGPRASALRAQQDPLELAQRALPGLPGRLAWAPQVQPGRLALLVWERPVQQALPVRLAPPASEQQVPPDPPDPQESVPLAPQALAQPERQGLPAPLAQEPLDLLDLKERPGQQVLQALELLGPPGPLE